MTTNTIGTSGRTYSTASAWADDCGPDISGGGDDWIGECYNDGTITEIVNVALDSIQASNARMILRCATGHSFKDHADKLTNPLRPDQTKGVLFNITTHTGSGFGLGRWARVEGLQITDARNALVASRYGEVTNTVSEMGRMTGCLMRVTGGSSYTSSLARVTYANCGIILTGNNGRALWDESTASGRVTHCTIVNVNGSSSYRAIDSSAAAFGNATFGWGADNIVGTSSTNNATNRADFATNSSSDQESLTTTDQIESATSGSEDLRLKSTNTIATAGVRDQDYTNDLDIVGQSRSTTTPSIGCWEYVAGGGSAVQSLMQISG